MADPTITIRLKTAADVAGAKAATEAVDAVTEAAQSATGAMRPMTDASQGAAEALHETAQAADAAAAGTGAVNEVSTQTAEELEELRKKVEELTREMKELREGADDASGPNGSQGLMQLSRIMQTVQVDAGDLIRVIPRIATALRLSTGSAGLAIAGLVAGLAALQKVMAELKSDVPATLLSDLSPSAAAQARLDKFNDGLKAQVEIINDLRDAWREERAEIDAAAEAEERLRAMRRQEEDETFEPSGDPIVDAVRKREIEIERIEEDRRARQLQRQSKLEDAREDAAAAAGGAVDADKNLKEQQAKVAGMDKRALLAERAAYLEGEIKKNTALAEGRLDPLKDPKGAMRRLATLMGLGDDRADVARQGGDQLAEWQKIQADMKGLPSLPGVKSTGDDKADREEQAALIQKESDKLRDLEDRREKAREEEEAARRKLEQAGASYNREESIDDEGTAIAKKRAERKAQAEFDRLAKPPEPEPAQAEIDALQGDLRAKARQTGDATVKAMLEGFANGLTDVDGATAPELEQIRQLYSRLTSNKDESVALISNIVKALAEAQERTVGKVQADMAEVRARLDAMQNRN